MNIHLMNGFVDLNTLSSNGLYYYQITKPSEITNGNWGCKLKFCKLNGELIYYNSKTFAHSFNIDEERFNIVAWSKDGNVVTYYEFKYGEIYDFVVIFLKKNFCYRIDLRKNFKIEELIFFIENNNEVEILNEYSSFVKSDLIKDSISKSFFKSEVWYPHST